MPGLPHRRNSPPRASDLLRHPLFWVLLASTLLRVYTLLGVSVSLGYSDSNAYTRMAMGEPGLGISPPGYALFLRISHGISNSVDLVLALQHLMVLAAGVAVYAMARELSCRRGTAATASGVLVLCGNLLATAQGLLTETLFVTLITFAGWGAVRAMRRGRLLDVALCGAAAGLAISVRTVGVPLLLLFGVALVIAGYSRRDRLARAGTILASSVAAVLLIAVLAGTSNGLPGAGPTASGWLLYGRVATFADCPATYAPSRLRSLCPGGADASLRPGPDYWRVVGGPALERFKGVPNGDAQLQEFSLEVIQHQPLSYLRAIFVDTMRFFSPNFGKERPYAGAGWDELELDRPLDGASAAYNKDTITTYFADYTPRTSAYRVIGRYQEATTLTPGWWAVLALLAICGPILARGRRRGIALTLFLGAGGLMVAATALNMYVARYALPSLGLALPVAALGFEALARRVTSTPEPVGFTDDLNDPTPEPPADGEPDASADQAHATATHHAVDDAALAAPRRSPHA